MLLQRAKLWDDARNPIRLNLLDNKLHKTLVSCKILRFIELLMNIKLRRSTRC